MNRLTRRLENLEARVTRSDMDITFSDVYEAALQKLDGSERELVRQIMQNGVSPYAPTHQSAWSELQVAIENATRELGFPVLITGMDLLA